MRKKGFTLIELLVVISIIALLMSILMPSLGRAKAQAKDVLCMSNQKQVGLYLSMYVMGNRDELIETYDWARWTQERDIPVRWSDRLFYEFGNKSSSEVFYCPSSKVPKGVDKKWAAEYEFAAIPTTCKIERTHASFTYGLRTGTFDYGTKETGGFTKLDPLKLSKVRSPSTFFLLTDVTYQWEDPAGPYYSPELAGSHFYLFDPWHSFYMVHSKGTNILMADMSVAKYKLEQTVKEIPNQRDMWFVDNLAFIYPGGRQFDADGIEMP